MGAATLTRDVRSHGEQEHNHAVPFEQAMGRLARAHESHRGTALKL